MKLLGNCAIPITGRASIARVHPIGFANDRRRESDKSAARAEAAGEPVPLLGHRFQNPCDGIRNARLKREDAFSHAMTHVSSTMVSLS